MIKTIKEDGRKEVYCDQCKFMITSNFKITDPLLKSGEMDFQMNNTWKKRVFMHFYICPKCSFKIIIEEIKDRVRYL